LFGGCDNGKLSSIKIDRPPAQRCDFAAPQPAQDCEHQGNERSPFASGIKDSRACGRVDGRGSSTKLAGCAIRIP